MKEISAQNERRSAENRIVNFRTLLFCALFLCLGIIFSFLRLVYGCPFWLAFLIIPLTALICFLAFTKEQWRRILVSVSLLFVSFTLGAFVFSWRIQAFQSTQNYNGAYTVSGKVIEMETDGDTFVVVVDNLFIEGRKEKGTLTAYLSEETYHTLALSQEVALYGELQTRTDLITDHGFRAYAVEENARYTMTADSGVVLGNDFDLFLSIRKRVETVVRAGMDETPASVTIATLTGNTSFIEEGLLDNIRRGGIAHIFAVSGLHVGALYGFCLWIIERTRLCLTPKAVRFFLLTAILIFYGGICGYSASVVRAIVTCLLFYFTKLTGLRNDALETASLSAIVVLLLSPVSLFTVGFQLSFSAFFGIVLLSRPITKCLYGLGDFIRYTLLRKERKPFVLEEDTHPLNNWQRFARFSVSIVSSTVAAQIATLPLQMLTFGYLSVFSLLLNCLFVPIVCALFSTLLTFVFIACCLPVACSFVVLYIPNAVWSALLLVFEGITFTATNTVVFPTSAVCSYYLSAVFCSGKWNVSKRITRILAITFALMCICTLVVVNVS